MNLRETKAGRRGSIAAAIAICAVLLSCGSEESRHNIIFITIDTIRADHLGVYGYFRNTSPVIDALAAESVLFERCIAPMATTLPTHLSLMTGTYPVEHGVMANVGDGGIRYVPSPSLRTFAQFASESGYATAAFVSATPLKAHSGIAAGFDLFDEPDGAERKAAVTTDAVLSWLAESPEEPYFLWVHYFDPHAPYTSPLAQETLFEAGPELQAYLDERHFAEEMVQYDDRAFPTPTVVSLYDAEIRYTDQEIGRLLEGIGGEKAWRKTLPVLVGDHGEGLGQHDEYHHGLVWGEQIHVPLLFRVPGEPPGRVADLISVVDVVPTLFAYIDGIPAEGFLAQASGINRVFDGSPRALISQSSSRRRTLSDPLGTYALTTDRWKYLHRVAGGDALYDLHADPYELENRIDAEPETAALLKEQMRAELERQVDRGVLLWGGKVPRSEPLDPQVREELKSLGYVD